MTIDKKFINQFINVSSRAALASSYTVGKKDKIIADQAAVDAMREELNKIDMIGEIVIGEGALDDAPMLYTGEILGSKKGPQLDIAVDPLEGTNFAANNLPGAISVISVAEKLKETFKSNININVSKRYRLGDIRNNFADLKRLKSDFDCSSFLSFDEGLGIFVDWVKNQ